jgi:hypothetical protein
MDAANIVNLMLTSSFLEVIKTPRSERMVRIHSAEIRKDKFRVSAFESNFLSRRGSGRGF